MTESAHRVRAVCIAAREYLAACHLSRDCWLQANAILEARDIAFGIVREPKSLEAARGVHELREIYRALPGGASEESERFRLAEAALIEDLEVAAVVIARASYLMPTFNRSERGSDRGK